MYFYGRNYILSMKILIINGPNLNLVGKREPGIYGNMTFEEYLLHLREFFSEIEIDYYQSNIEGELINAIHGADGNYTGVLINAGGYTHTSVALGDAIGGVGVPVVEVHISSILAREEFRHVSYIASKCKGSIMGFGLASYKLAIHSFYK